MLYDRPTLAEHMAACVLTFSDGSKVDVYAVPNDGSAKTVVFEPRTVTSLKLDVVDGVGEQIGLSEIEVYYDPTAQPATERSKAFTDYVSYVDPTIETGRGRWFFCTPGSRPFGMVCASAYTRNKNQGGGGYNYNSTEILGFANIHAWIMSGINIMPTTGEVNPNLGEKGWKSRFSHDTEIIEPGYHKLFLDRYKTQVEYTSTDRVAFYRLTYREAAQANLLLQLGGFVGACSYVDGKAKLVSPTRIEGSHGMTDRLWGGPKLSHVFFVMELDRPILRMDGWKGRRRTAQRYSRVLESDPGGASCRRAISKLSRSTCSRTSRKNRRALLWLTMWRPATRSRSRSASPTRASKMPAEPGGGMPSLGFRSGPKRSPQPVERMAREESTSKVARRRRASSSTPISGTCCWAGTRSTTSAATIPVTWGDMLASERESTETGRIVPLVVRRVPMDEAGKPKHHMYNSDALWLTMWNLNILWGLGWPEMLDDFSASMVEYAGRGRPFAARALCRRLYRDHAGLPATSLITATWQKGLLRKVDEEQAYQAMKRSHPLSSETRGAGDMVQGAFEYWALAQMAEEMGHDEDLPDPIGPGSMAGRSTLIPRRTCCPGVGSRPTTGRGPLASRTTSPD